MKYGWIKTEMTATGHVYVRWETDSKAIRNLLIAIPAGTRSAVGCVTHTKWMYGFELRALELPE